MIAIVDYGLGNVRAFENVYKKLNFQVEIVKTPEILKIADKIILPGVGSFDYAMESLTYSGMLPMLIDLVLGKRIPILGVCVGMQMLAESSEEGKLPGLGWIKGFVKKFDHSSVQVPHMGWNTINPKNNNNLFNELDHESRFYFLHSYFFKCLIEENIIAMTDYYGNFTCAVRKDNIYGVQFHPEKSHEWGIKLLENFAKI